MSKVMSGGISRRNLLKTTSAAALIGAVKAAFPSGAFAGGRRPGDHEGRARLHRADRRLGADHRQRKGFFAKHGMPDVEVVKQASWGTTRDNLVLGSEGNGIDGAHILTPMPYLISTGTVTQNNQPMPMHILARLNLDAQAISVAAAYKDLGVAADAGVLKEAFAEKKAAGSPAKVAMTFPGGTHDLWLRYWLAAGGIDPDSDVETITVPPPQMVANMKVGTMDCFCVGEPWNAQLVNQGIGFTAVNTAEIWAKHPEKSLGMRAAWVEKNPNAAKALLMAVMEAQMWCDDFANKEEMAEIVGRRAWFNVPERDIIDRIKGKYDYGDGRVVAESPHFMKFWRDHASYPFQSHELWFLTEDIRWGKLPPETDTKGAHRARSTARICGARRRRSSASRRRISRHRPRAGRRPSSTARSSIRRTRRPISPAFPSIASAEPQRTHGELPMSITALKIEAEKPAWRKASEVVALPFRERSDLGPRLANIARATAERVVPPLITLVVLTAIWQLLCSQPGSPLPAPTQVVDDTWELIVDPFYVGTGLDQGMFWQILASLQRVALGYAIAAGVGIAVGTLIGQFVWAMRGLDPIFQVLRTVPPLAWLPLSLAAFQDGQPSAIFVIFITAVWPIIINTAVGIRNIPQDYRNVAQVLRLSGPEYFIKIMVPAAAPYIFTGLRIGIGLSWLAIVAAEMLIGGVGIGFFIWDAWNSSQHQRHHPGARLCRAGRLRARPDRRPHCRHGYPWHGHRMREATMTNAYLSLELIDKTFDTRRRATEVLKDVSLSVEKGEYVSIIGHSGCGKSTVLNIVAGLIPATRGVVLLEGKVVDAPGPDRAVVFQNHSLAPVADRLRERPPRRGQGVPPLEDEERAPRLDDAQSRPRPDGARQGQAAGRNLRRHEAARRHRPGARHGAEGAPPRRAVRRARRADAGAPAGHRHADPCEPRQHGPDDHARCRRGRAALRPDRHDDERPGGGDRSDPRRAAGAAAAPARARGRPDLPQVPLGTC